MKVKPNVNETKITCPVCLSKNCFEETFEKDDNSFSSYMCFRCGFSSNSQYTHDSPDTENIRKSSTALINEVSFYDEEREILWFPTVLNMGNLTHRSIFEDAIAFNEVKDHFTFNFTIIESPDSYLNINNTNLHNVAARILEDVIERGEKEGWVKLEDKKEPFK